MELTDSYAHIRQKLQAFKHAFSLPQAARSLK